MSARDWPADWGEERGLRPYAVGLVEAAAYIGLSVPGLRRRIARGELRAAKVGRRVLVRLSDLEAFLDRFLSEPEPDPLADLSPREGGNP